MPETATDSRSANLTGSGAVSFRVTDGGNFLDPTDDLARLLLGSNACAKDLADRRAGEFWVEADYRNAFLERVREAAGKQVTEVLLLQLAGARTYCRCTSIFQGPNQYAGVLVRLAVPIRREEAYLSAVRLCENVSPNLGEFEQKVAKAAAAWTPLGTAAYFRYDVCTRTFMLRAEHGVPASVRLPRKFQQERLSQGARVVSDAAPLGGPSATSSELLAVVRDPSAPAPTILGCLWLTVPNNKVDDAIDVLSSFADALAVIVNGAEFQAAQQAAERALRQAVEMLVGKVPGHFYRDFLESVLKEIPAEGGGIFQVVEPCVLALAATKTGIEGVDRSQEWTQVRYRLGEWLTGVVALESRAVAFLDFEQARRVRGLGPPRFPDRTTHKPTTWLGCPIYDERRELTAFVRLVNRKLPTGGPPTGFSEGDIRLIEALAAVVPQYQELARRQKEHESVMARTFHELRAPLLGIHSNADYLADNPKSDRLEVKLRNIVVDAELAIGLLDDVDVAARDRAPRTEPVRLYQDVIVPLRYGLRELARRNGYSDILIDSDRLQGFPVLQLDVRMMRQVFSNLFTNSIKYGPTPSSDGKAVVRIEVEWESARTRDKLHVIVRDFGMGIVDSARTRVFDPYFRAEEAKRRDPTGTGIGLHVVKRILARHGGTAWLRSASNPTEFVLSFPSP